MRQPINQRHHKAPGGNHDTDDDQQCGPVMVVEYPRVHFGEMVEDVEMEQRQAFVHEALLQVEAGIDPRSIGAAVTIALCGHYEQEGVCRWPHNNDICTDTSPARFRTLFVSD